MEPDETPEDILEDLRRVMRMHSREPLVQRTDRFERIMRRLTELSEDEIQSIRASILNQHH